jgi:hypothetical protein
MSAGRADAELLLFVADLGALAVVPPHAARNNNVARRLAIIRKYDFRVDIDDTMGQHSPCCYIISSSRWLRDEQFFTVGCFFIGGTDTSTISNKQCCRE